MKNEYHVDIDIEYIQFIHAKYNTAITGFYEAVRELYEAGDEEGLKALMATVSGMIRHLGGQPVQPVEWVSQHIKGEC